MNTCNTCCNPKTPDCGTVEMSNLQRCNGVTMHGCGNPMYNVYCWDHAHPMCHKPEPCAVAMLCEYLTKTEAAKMYINRQEFYGFDEVIRNTYATKDEFVVGTEQLQNALESEIASRTTADNVLEGRIDAYRDELGDKIDTEIQRATSAESQISSSVNNEVVRAQQAESTIASNLNNEINRALGVENTLTSNLNTEVNRAQSAELTLTTSINTEKTRAQSAELTISTSLNNYISTNNNTVSALNTKVTSDLVHSADYDSTNKQILFKNSVGTVIDTIDASAFIKDGMVSNVRIVNGVLKITFNTDAGHSDIDIPISDIFDANNYYTKSAADDNFATKTQLNNYYTKAEVDQAIADALVNYYTKTETDSKFAEVSVEESIGLYWRYSSADDKYYLVDKHGRLLGEEQFGNYFANAKNDEISSWTPQDRVSQGFALQCGMISPNWSYATFTYNGITYDPSNLTDAALIYNLPTWQE